MDEQNRSQLACSVCGALLKSSWKFCSKCGNKVDNEYVAPCASASNEASCGGGSSRLSKDLPALSAATTTFEKANKAYGAPVRGRRRQRPPSDFSSGVLQQSRALLENRQQGLAMARAARSKQERMVTLLEMNNIVSRDAELGMRRKTELRPGSGSTHFNLKTPRLQEVSPSKFPLRDRLQELKPALNYTEWHLKANFGVHDVEERIKADLAEVRLMQELEKEEDDQNAELQQMQRYEQDKRREDEYVEVCKADVDTKSENDYLNAEIQKAAVGVPVATRNTEPGEEVPTWKDGTVKMDPEDSHCNYPIDEEKLSQQRREILVGDGRFLEAVASTNRENLRTERSLSAPGSGSGANLRRDLQSAPSMAAMVGSTAANRNSSSSPMHIAPGTPLSGPQSLPSSFTAIHYTGSKPHILPVGLLEATDRLANQRICRSPNYYTKKGDKKDDGDFSLSRNSGSDTNEFASRSWFWGSKHLQDNDIVSGTVEADEETGSIYIEDDKSIVDLLSTNEDEKTGKQDLKPRSTGLFWRGNSGVETMAREQVKKRESAAYERALDIGNIASESKKDDYTSTNVGDPNTLPAVDNGRVDVVSLDDQSALSGSTQTEFAAVSGTLTRLEEPDKAHPKDITFGQFRGWWSKYVAHLFENGTGRRGVRGLRHGFRDLGDDDGAQDQIIHERLLGLLNEETKRFLKPNDVQLVVEELRALKARVIQCYRHEKKMGVSIYNPLFPLSSSF